MTEFCHVRDMNSMTKVTWNIFDHMLGAKVPSRSPGCLKNKENHKKFWLNNVSNNITASNIQYSTLSHHDMWTATKCA